MINVKDTFGTVFQVEKEDKYVKATLSTSEKKSEGVYDNMSWNAIFCGKCLDLAKELTNASRIKINSAVMKNSYNKESKTSYVTIVIFEFEKIK